MEHEQALNPALPVEDKVLEKLAWLIAEEFVDTFQMLQSLMWAEPRPRSPFRLSRRALSPGKLRLAWQA